MNRLVEAQHGRWRIRDARRIEGDEKKLPVSDFE